MSQEKKVLVEVSASDRERLRAVAKQNGKKMYFLVGEMISLYIKEHQIQI